MIPLPNKNNSFVDNKGKIQRPWDSYLQQFTQAPPKIMTVIVGATPFAYTVKEPGMVSVTGGTITTIVLSRGTDTIDVTGTKLIPVSINDVVTVDYTVLPTIKFIPSYGQNTTNA